MKKYIIIGLLLALVFANQYYKDSKLNAVKAEINSYDQLYFEVLDPLFGENGTYYTDEMLVYIREIESSEKWLQMQDIIKRLREMWPEAGEDGGGFISSVLKDNKNLQTLIEHVHLCDGSGATTFEKMTENQRKGFGALMSPKPLRYDDVQQDREAAEN